MIGIGDFVVCIGRPHAYDFIFFKTNLIRYCLSRKYCQAARTNYLGFVCLAFMGYILFTCYAFKQFSVCRSIEVSGSYLSVTQTFSRTRQLAFFNCRSVATGIIDGIKRSKPINQLEKSTLSKVLMLYWVKMLLVQQRISDYSIN